MADALPFVVSVTTPTGTARHVYRAVSADEAEAQFRVLFPDATIKADPLTPAPQ